MIYKQLENLRNEAQKKHEDIDNELKSIERKFAIQCLEKAGFKLGQTIEHNGQKGVINNVYMGGIYPRVTVNKIKKDGNIGMNISTDLCNFVEREIRKSLGNEYYK